MLQPNEEDGYTVGFSGYAARIEGSQGACSVRYYIKAGAGKHWAHFRANELYGDSDKKFKDAIPGIDFEAKTGWLHWAAGDTGIRHFAVKAFPNSDVYTDNYDKRLCVVIDQPSGCGLKACFRRDSDIHDCQAKGGAPDFLNTGLQYYEMSSIELATNTFSYASSVSSGSWPPKGEPRCGLYTHPFGDPERDLVAAQDGGYGDTDKKGPATGFLFPYAPRLEMTVFIEDEGETE
jgi:hypothetical protein